MKKIIVGIDEAGRGPWAGPLTACAVAFSPGQSLPNLTDSKLITGANRQKLYLQITKSAICVGIGWATPAQVDSLGLTKATAFAMRQALGQIYLEPAEVIIDGSIDYLKTSISRNQIKADSLYPCVSAASVIAKVARDKYMCQLAKLYPGYGLEKHVGYGTRYHKEALLTNGLLPIHRRSFAPIRALI